jgi:hypothetical protein
MTGTTKLLGALGLVLFGLLVLTPFVSAAITKKPSEMPQSFKIVFYVLLAMIFITGAAFFASIFT